MWDCNILPHKYDILPNKYNILRSLNNMYIYLVDSISVIPAKWSTLQNSCLEEHISLSTSAALCLAFHVIVNT